MMFLENIKMALVSLKNAKLRSFLTMLGIIIGVAAVVSILAIGAGVKQAVQDQITGVVNASAISVTSGKIDLKGGKGSNPAATIGASTLTTSDIDRLSKLQNVVAVAPLSPISSNVTGNGAPTNSELVLATNADFVKTQTFKFASGRFFNADEASKPVAVLGGSAAKDLFGDSNAQGQTISIKGYKLTVIGVLQAPDAAASSFSVGPSLDSAVYLPVDFGTKIAGSTPSILRILVQVNNVSNVNSTADAMREALLANHGGQEDFTVLRQKDILKSIDTILSLLTTFIVAIASISLLVGGIGIMNIMLVSVTERTREIGLRKAVGASSVTVLGQFLIEAVVLSLFGGALGIAAAIGMATVGGKLAKITPIFTPSSIGLAVGVSAAVGIIFGIAPAIKAARKRPIQALKAE